MKLDNRTEHQALLLRNVSARSSDHMIGCVIARSTYQVHNGALRPTPEQSWPLGQEPEDTPLGSMPGDKGVYMGGIDVLVGGSVRQPGGEARPRLDVEIEVGRTFRRRIAVFGDRTWQAGKDGKLSPSEPKPFRAMELSYGRAFGGCAFVAGPQAGEPLPLPHAANPDGVGFYLDADSAVGQPLPNLEDPNQLIAAFDDSPTPVGCGYYPLSGGLRAAAAIDHPLAQAMAEGRLGPATVDPSSVDDFGPERVKPTLFNMAHPAMVIDADKGPQAGDRVRLSHGLRDGDLSFLLPDVSLHLHVQLEERDYLFPLHLDQIGLVAGSGQVMLSQRCVFEYRTVKRERRLVTLHAGPVPEHLPTGYHAKLEPSSLAAGDWAKG